MQLNQVKFNQMKTLTSHTAKVITSVIAYYVIFTITSSCVIDKKICCEEAVSKTAKPAQCPKSGNTGDNISTTGLLSLGGMQLL